MELSVPDLQLEGRVLRHGTGRALGLVSPGTLLGDGGRRILGPRRLVHYAGPSAEGYVGALIAAGALVTGTSKELRELEALLDDDRSSRTTSYLCTRSVRAREVLTAVATLRRATVVVFGAGGIGSLSAMLLAGCGVRRLVLVDPDVVETSNFNRQLFWELDDVGRPKVEVLAERIRRRHRDVVVEPRAQLATPARIGALLDAEREQGLRGVLSSIDEPLDVWVEVARAALARQTAWVAAGYPAGVGRVFTDLPADLPREVDAERFARHEGSIMPSFGPQNAELAGSATRVLLEQIFDPAVGAAEPHHDPVATLVDAR